VAAAWIGFAGGVFAAVLSSFVALRQAQITKQLAELERAEQAEAVLKRYREPLAAAAFDLQSRLYNILRLKFFEKFGNRSRAHCSGWLSTSAGPRSSAATSSF
jgi:hypothetical protein